MKNIYYYFKYKKLIEFIEKNIGKPFPKNQWFYYKKIAVYLRTSYRYIDNEKEPTIEIATIMVYEKYRNKKVFSKFLDLLENVFPSNIIFFENVLNPELYLYLSEKRKYKELEYLDQCLYFSKN